MTHLEPEALASHYRRFAVSERVLLTGHSHQAWPDVAHAAQLEAWNDAATHVDDKWEYAFATAQRLKTAFAEMLGEAEPSQLALGASTHDLVVRWLSALPLTTKPRLVTTDGEFHSLRRQLDRLREERVDVVRVNAREPNQVVERLCAELTADTAAVLVSAVLFKNARIVPGLHELAAACERLGVPLLIDAYHAVNALPFELPKLGLETAYVVGGGYKYCQMGEGNCFLRVPVGCSLRPVITGWYAEFGTLEGQTTGVAYPPGGDRFQGSTYDPTSHYRGAAVADFFRAQSLTPSVLRSISQRQVGRVLQAVTAEDLDPAIIAAPDCPLDEIGGFVALQTRFAATLAQRLKAEHIWVDYRADTLRLGPAPYVTDAQLDMAVAALVANVRQMQAAD